MPAKHSEEALAGLIREQFASVLSKNVPTALLDFPDHPNVGDSAIWSGEIAALRSLGYNIQYVCDMNSYRESVMRQRMSYGQLLMHGGGNYGTVWAASQFWREAVIRRCHDYRIVQLPQTLHFDDQTSLDRARDCVRSHPDYFLMTRDHRSLAIATDQLGVRALLCPDAALMLHGSIKRLSPTKDVLVLSRTDKEAQASGLSGFVLPNFSISKVDWLDEDRTALTRTVQAVKQLSLSSMGSTRTLQFFQRKLFANLADARVQRGVRTLSIGRIVVTDRLHAHIICMMLGIPHVVLDNNYGKLSEFINCWHADQPLVRLVKSVDEAQTAATLLLKGLTE